MTGLTLPEWIAVTRQSIKQWREIHEGEIAMKEWADGWEACVLSLESDMQNGLLQGVVK